MNPSRPPFQRASVGQLARDLEMHPFELVRLLVAENMLSADLRYSTADAARIGQIAGLEMWWTEPPRRRPGETQGQALMQAVLLALFQRRAVDPHLVRADNLFRGLDPETRTAMRRVVNALIREGVLVSRMTPHGLSVTMPPGMMDAVRSFLEEGSGGLVEVWRAL